MRDFFSTPASFFIVAIAIGVLIFFSSPLVPHYGSDAEWYIAIANGHIGDVIKPFSGRFLEPFLAGRIAVFSGADTSQSFLILAVLSLISFLALIAVFFKKIFKSSLLLIPVLFIPYFAVISQAYFLPDLFYLFLAALFFFFLAREMEGAGLLVLFLMFLTRESTVLLGLVLLAVSLWRSKKLFAAAVFVVMALSIFTTQQITNLGLPNVHNLGNFSYLVLKVPYNFLNNVLGAKLWVNTLANNCNPVFTTALPPQLSVGSINRIGFCGFNPSSVYRVLVTLLSVFGVMPLVLLYLLISKFKLVMARTPFWLAIAMIYGLICYFLSVFTTGAVEKFAGYGWPAFLLAVPLLMGLFFRNDGKFLVKISLVHFFVAWLPAIVSKYGIVSPGYFWFVALVILGAYFYAFRLLKSQIVPVV